MDAVVRRIEERRDGQSDGPGKGQIDILNDAELGELLNFLRGNTFRATSVLVTGDWPSALGATRSEEAINRPNIDWQDKIQGDFTGPQKYF